MRTGCGLLLALTLVPSMASAQASRKADVDGDGVPDEVALDAAGALTVTSGKTRKVVAFKAAVKGKRAEVQVTPPAVKPPRPPTVIAAMTEREAVALEWAGGALREVWRGAVGPEPPDGESTLRIEAGDYGLVRYHGRAGIQRCDEKTAYLFAEVFDFKHRRFTPADRIPVRAGDNARRLVASQTPPAGAAPDVMPGDFKVLAASSQSAAHVTGDLVAPVEIDDGKLDTAWVEGQVGAGAGEFVTARASISGGRVAAVRIVPGHAGSAKMLAAHNRVREVVLLVGRDAVFTVELPDLRAKGGGAWWITLPQPVATDCVSLVVKSVYAANPRAHGHTAISELAVLTEMDLTPGGGLDVLAARVAAGGREGEEAARTLEKVGPRAEAALLAEAQRPGAGPDALLRLRRALASLPAGSEELARGLAVEDVHESDVERFERALVAIGAPSVAPLAKVIGARDADAEGRARAAHALGRVADPAAAAALLAAAGAGPRVLRREVALALGGRPAGELQALVDAATAAAQASEGREADLWRAVGVMGHDAPAGAARTSAAAGIAARLTSSGVGYELRYRLIEAAAELADDALVALAAAEAAPSTTTALKDAEKVGLRRVAVAALAQVDRPAASRAVIAAIADPDPGVRELAAGAMAARPDAAGDAPLATLLASDRWARVRRAAATGLGGRCRPAPDGALRKAALGDADIDVRTAALDGMSRCAGATRFFLELARNGDQPAGARRHAVHLVGVSRDRAFTRPLLDLLARERERAFSDAGALGIAVATCYALGTLGDPAAIPALRATAAEGSAFPELERAATTALRQLPRR